MRCSPWFVPCQAFALAVLLVLPIGAQEGTGLFRSSDPPAPARTPAPIAGTATVTAISFATIDDAAHPEMPHPVHLGTTGYILTSAWKTTSAATSSAFEMERLSDLFSNAAHYQSAFAAMCFQPGIAAKVVVDGKERLYAICLSCFKIQRVDGPATDPVEWDFSADGRAAFAAAYARLFLFPPAAPTPQRRVATPTTQPLVSPPVVSVVRLVATPPVHGGAPTFGDHGQFQAWKPWARLTEDAVVFGLRHALTQPRTFSDTPTSTFRPEWAFRIDEGGASVVYLVSLTDEAIAVNPAPGAAMVVRRLSTDGADDLRAAYVACLLAHQL